ncbi:hypothetical protein Dsin_028484 [Dipteronia sinensis]|uniref:Uncharacterized protein n=1 Tax=Dipteronia sinensis TaxID=43782 RepID=A0AAD9ZQH7_9ROSI|nr:hypothetical protein Dsin_028484 [Dipteronia sinensis]
MNCKELIHSLPDEYEIELCADGGESFIVNFINCLKLNQKAVSNLLIFFQVSVQKMELMGIEKIISLIKVCPPLHPPYLSLVLSFLIFIVVLMDFAAVRI